MSAPVCNINPANPPPQSKAPQLPSIPLATTDPLSLQNTVNQIRQWIIQYSNQISSTATPKPPPVANFVVTGQNTVTTRIYANNDPSSGIYIDVDQIVGVNWENPVTGQTISWKQTPS